MISACLIAVGMSGCQPVTTEKEVTFDELFATPKYNGKDIILTGFYFHGFEVEVLCENLELSGLAEGHMVPTGRMLWVEGGITKEVYDRLYTQPMMGPIERFGKVRVTGRFSYGGKFGHLGAYDAQITPSAVELLDWKPLEK